MALSNQEKPVNWIANVPKYTVYHAARIERIGIVKQVLFNRKRYNPNYSINFRNESSKYNRIRYFGYFGAPALLSRQGGLWAYRQSCGRIRKSGYPTGRDQVNSNTISEQTLPGLCSALKEAGAPWIEGEGLR